MIFISCNQNIKKSNEKFPNLPAYEKYKEFDKIQIIDYYSDYCDKLDQFNDDDKNLCKKIASYLKQLSVKSENERKNGCYYFTHWFYGQIGKNYYNGKELENKYARDELFNLVALIIKDNDVLKHCACYESGNPEVWKEEKDLHDYF
ncbi:variable surface protein, partial [Plasmodium gonderi]